MKFKQAFKRYYSGPLFLSQCLFAIAFFRGFFEKTLEGPGTIVIAYFLCTLSITVILGSICFFYEMYYQGWRVKRLMSKNGLQGLKYFGFKYEDKIPAFTAIYRSYFTLILVRTDLESENIMIGSLIDLKEEQIDLLTQWDNAKNHEVIITEDGQVWVFARLPVFFGRVPNSLKIKSKLDSVIDQIRRLELHPVEVIEA